MPLTLATISPVRTKARRIILLDDRGLLVTTEKQDKADVVQRQVQLGRVQQRSQRSESEKNKFNEKYFLFLFFVVVMGKFLRIAEQYDKLCNNLKHEVVDRVKVFDSHRVIDYTFIIDHAIALVMYRLLRCYRLFRHTRLVL